MQFFADRYRHFLTYSPTVFVAHIPSLAFNLVQTANRVQRLFGQLTFVRDMQVEELAASMSHAADFSNALLKTGFVAREVIADQLAIPGVQEVARMFACPAMANSMITDPSAGRLGAAFSGTKAGSEVVADWSR